MTIIIIGAILIFIVSCVWTWHNLGVIERPRKIVFIIISLIIMYLITLMVFQMSKNGISYPDYLNEKVEGTTKNMIVLIFTGLNSLILTPFLAYIYGKYTEEDLEAGKAVKRIIIGIVIFIICIFMETSYMKDVQQGILNDYYREVQNAKG